MYEISCAIFNIFSSLRKINGLNKLRVESFGLNNLQSIILFHINKVDNLTQKDLVTSLQVPKQTINSVILDLKEKGFISLGNSISDKRVKTLLLTEKGKKEVEKITDALSLSNQKLYQDLGDEKIKILGANLKDLIAALEKNIIEEEV